MKTIFQYIRLYFSETDKRLLFAISVFTAALVFSNYYYGVDFAIRKNNSPGIKLIYWYAVFLAAFSIPYLLMVSLNPKGYFFNKAFLTLLFLAPLVFAFKNSVDIKFNLSGTPVSNNYWNYIIYWPFLLLVVGTILFFLWKIFDKHQPFYGLSKRNIHWSPYLLMLLIMLPLVAAASTQADFLAVYPKLKSVTSVYNETGLSWWQKLLFELSYGSDFITIELFFRGFLILAFIKWAGKDAILPMACFYCTIHFGKPLGECISSYFGGIILGVIVYHTRSIYGGLIVHLGIAWMMELGGYLSPLFRFGY